MDATGCCHRIGRAQREVDDVHVHVDVVGTHRPAVDQFECLQVLVRGFVGSADGQCLVACLHTGDDGGVDVPGEPGVVGELGRGALDRARSDDSGERPVQPYPLAGK